MVGFSREAVPRKSNQVAVVLVHSSEIHVVHQVLRPFNLVPVLVVDVLHRAAVVQDWDH